MITWHRIRAWLRELFCWHSFADGETLDDGWICRCRKCGMFRVTKVDDGV